ncbi:MAG: hypothetical protein SGPRY_008499, partial [Prymnesium sp.]
LAAALICRAGFYRPSSQFLASNFSAPCLPCPQGHAKPASEWSTAECSPCAAGSVANGTANPDCTVCPVGTRQPLSGQAECAQCEPGTYRDRFATNARTCTACNASMFMPIGGADACILCPNNSETGEGWGKKRGRRVGEMEGRGERKERRRGGEDGRRPRRAQGGVGNGREFEG